MYIRFFFLSILVSAFSNLYASSNAITSQHLQNLTAHTNEHFITQNDSIPPDSAGMRDIGSLAISEEMVPGWNVGNSLEAIGGETAWGNPKITEDLIDSVKAAGFNSIRIPVAWSNGMDMETFEIDTALMSRVEEVVNYVLDNDMYAIINIHWDNGWIVPTYEEEEYVNDRLSVIWKQIAVHFRDYRDRLLFAGTNEVMVEGDYGTPTEEYYTVQNGYNQTFVNTVRSTGGRNTYRLLIVQGFNTNIDYTDRFFKMPEDSTEKRLMVEVHYYDPYNFTLNTNSNVIQWGKNTSDSLKVEDWADEDYADGQFRKMKTNFIDKGYPVLLGEYGAIARTNLGSGELNNLHAEFRRYYIEYITESSYRHGLVPVYWDNGQTGNHGLGIFDRSTGQQVYEAIIQSIMAAVDTSHATSVEPQGSTGRSIPDGYALKQNYPNPFNPTTSITYHLPQSGKITLQVYDVMGRSVKKLVDAVKPAGTYTIQFNASGLSSGTYIYQLESSTSVGVVMSKRMIFLK